MGKLLAQKESFSCLTWQPAAYQQGALCLVLFFFFFFKQTGGAGQAAPSRGSLEERSSQVSGLSCPDEPHVLIPGPSGLSTR